MAVKLNRPIVFLPGDHFLSLSSSQQAITLTMLEKAILSFGGNQQILTMVSYEQGVFSGTGQHLVSNSSQVTILSARDEMVTLEVSESLANGSQKLLVSRLGGIAFKPNTLPFQQRLRWWKWQCYFDFKFRITWSSVGFVVMAKFVTVLWPFSLLMSQH